MFFAEDDHAVHAVPPNRTDHPFDGWILPWGSTSRNDLLDTDIPYSPTEEHAVDRGSVPKQEPGFGTVGRECLDDLLSGPLGRRVRRHVEVNDLTSLVGEDHEAVQQAEGDRGHDEEVAGDGALKMIPEEGAPRLG